MLVGIAWRTHPADTCHSMMPNRGAFALSLTVLLSVASGAPAQAPAPGFRLFGATNDLDVTLLDVNNSVVHRWTTLFRGKSIRFLPDGSLLRSIRIPRGSAPGQSGAIQRYALDGTLLWDWRYDAPGVSVHHDISVLPNGNVLLIAAHDKTRAEAIAAGRDPNTISQVFKPERIIEVQPTGLTTGTIVWEWDAWDHLVQDFDMARANFGVVANRPELLNINYPTGTQLNGDWLHFNGIDYDPVHDRILLSCPRMNEVWVIDHSTTTAEAKGSTGGRWKRGGDLLYRWGNPAAYDSGTTTSRVLGFQHSPTFIPQGMPGAGNILLFNNRYTAVRSSVVEFKPPLDASGAFLPRVGGVYGPVAPVWTYSDSGFYSAILSSARRLPNGNTLVCSGTQHWLFEVTPSGKRVWEYTRPGKEQIFQALHVDRTLWASAATLSVSKGGSVRFDLVAGTPRAADMHLVLASASGTSPGYSLGAYTLPLNLDNIFVFSYEQANGPFFPQTLGAINASGRSTAGFKIPSNMPPALVGLEARLRLRHLGLDDRRPSPSPR